MDKKQVLEQLESLKAMPMYKWTLKRYMELGNRYTEQDYIAWVFCNPMPIHTTDKWGLRIGNTFYKVNIEYGGLDKFIKNVKRLKASRFK